MINFPIAKINLGLNVLSKREDGYHNLETVFYPVPIKDALEVLPMHEGFPSDVRCDLKVTNLFIDGDEQKNLVVKAYNMIAQDYDLPRVHVHLYKHIPTQAGMGGGSSDCAYMIRLLNDMFSLGMSDDKMIGYAARLGADCAFFINSLPAYAEDFERSVFAIHPEIGMLKDKMYEQGAVYAAMSGSGSSVFGLFHDTPDEKSFVGCMDELTVFTVDMSDI